MWIGNGDRKYTEKELSCKTKAFGVWPKQYKIQALEGLLSRQPEPINDCQMGAGADQKKEHESVTESSQDLKMGQQRMLSFGFQEGCGHKRQGLQIMTSRGRVMKMAPSTAIPTTTHQGPSYGVGFGEPERVGGAVWKEESQTGQGCDARKNLRKKQNSMYNGAGTNCMVSRTG